MVCVFLFFREDYNCMVKCVFMYALRKGDLFALSWSRVRQVWSGSVCIVVVVVCSTL